MTDYEMNALVLFGLQVVFAILLGVACVLACKFLKYAFLLMVIVTGVLSLVYLAVDFACQDEDEEN